MSLRQADLTRATLRLQSEGHDAQRSRADNEVTRRFLSPFRADNSVACCLLSPFHDDIEVALPCPRDCTPPPVASVQQLACNS